MSNQGPGDLVHGLSEVADAAKGAMGQGTQSTDEAPKSADEGPKSAGENTKSSGVGLQQLLLTILAPTLALIGIAWGILDSNSKEAAAREREDKIRTAELVLPFYQEVITTQDAVDAAIPQCDADFETYLSAEINSDEEREAETAYQASCAIVTSGFSDLNTKINQALLVSDTDLEPVVEKYRLAQEEFEQLYTVGSPPEAECFPPEDLEGFSGADLDAQLNALEEKYGDQWFEAPAGSEEEASARRVIDCIQEGRQQALERAKTTLNDVREDLVKVVRAQVLLEQPRPSDEDG